MSPTHNRAPINNTANDAAMNAFTNFDIGSYLRGCNRSDAVKVVFEQQ